MCLQAKKYDRAIAILAKHSWWDKLILVVRDVPKDDKKNLSVCVQHFRKVRLYVCVCMVCVCVCVNVCVRPGLSLVDTFDFFVGHQKKMG